MWFLHRQSNRVGLCPQHEWRAGAELRRKLNGPANVTIIMPAQTTEVTNDGQKHNGLITKANPTDGVKKIDLESVFMHFGLLPNIDGLKGIVGLSKHDEIVVDAFGRTSDPCVLLKQDQA